LEEQLTGYTHASQTSCFGFLPSIYTPIVVRAH
jgi:hypothetical protein